jgi:hypothetical protein
MLHIILPLIISTGKACFLCEDEHATRNFAVANECTNCSPAVALPKQAPRILEHMAAHILFDSGIKRSDEPCGLCLRPSPLCKFYLKKRKGAATSEQIDFAKSTCANKLNFSYAVASTSTSSSPSSNVPIRCPVCPTAEPCPWRYNLLHHMRAKHPTISLTPYESAWQITHTEKRLLKEVWENRHKEKKARRSKKDKSTSLIILEVHSSRLALRYVFQIHSVAEYSLVKRDVAEDDRSDEDEYEDRVDLGSDLPEGIERDPEDPEGEEASDEILEQGLSNERGMDYDRRHSP